MAGNSETLQGLSDAKKEQAQPAPAPVAVARRKVRQHAAAAMPCRDRVGATRIGATCSDPEADGSARAQTQTEKEGVGR